MTDPDLRAALERLIHEWRKAADECQEDAPNALATLMRCAEVYDECADELSDLLALVPASQEQDHEQTSPIQSETPPTGEASTGRGIPRVDGLQAATGRTNTLRPHDRGETQTLSEVVAGVRAPQE